MKARNTLFAVLMLSLPAISAEHSEMKMTDMSTSASSQEYMAGMKDMHDKMMTAVNESDPDRSRSRLHLVSRSLCIVDAIMDIHGFSGPGR